MENERGVVALINRDGSAQVMIKRSDSCGDCGHSHCCTSVGASSKMEINAANEIGAGVGDLVSVRLGSSAVSASAFLLYLLPVIGLLAGAVVGAEINEKLPLGETGSAILLGMIGLGFGFFLIALISSNKSVQKWLTPVISRIIERNTEPFESPFIMDPVCRMIVNSLESAVRFSYQNKTYYFCNPACKEAFTKDPEKYLPSSPSIY